MNKEKALLDKLAKGISEMAEMAENGDSYYIITSEFDELVKAARAYLGEK